MKKRMFRIRSILSWTLLFCLLSCCSGILAEQEDSVRKALEDSGYRVLEVRRKKDWVAFAAERP